MQMAQTPLHVSAGNNRAEIIKFLLDWRGEEKVELEAKNMVKQNMHIVFTSFESRWPCVSIVLHLRFNFIISSSQYSNPI